MILVSTDEANKITDILVIGESRESLIIDKCHSFERF